MNLNISSYQTSSNFVKTLWQSTLVIILSIVIFIFYFRAEKQIDAANELRLKSNLLANELHKSSDELTRMVQTYIATKNVIYKEHYQEILAIRNGTAPRPISYDGFYWILIGLDNIRPYPYSNQTISLLDMMKNIGLTQNELDKLTEAKNNSDMLTEIELTAIKLVESEDNNSNLNKDKAQAMLFDEKYHLAKISIMKPIKEFQKLMQERTNYAVQKALNTALILRNIFIATGLLLLYMLFRLNTALKQQLGTTADELQSHISRIGKGDFSTEITLDAQMRDSVLGWLIEMQAMLKNLDDKNKESEEALVATYSLFEKLSQNIPGMIYQFKLRPDGHVSFPYASDGIEEIYEVKHQDVVEDAQALFDIFHPDDFNMIMASIQKSAETMNDWNIQYRVNLPKKGICWLEGHAKPEKLNDGSILWHGYINDITIKKNTENELSEQRNALEFQAHHDALTGLPNRILFQDRLEQALKEAKRKNTKVALLFIDLDHFKEINDSLGHDIGDEILKTVTTRLEASKRDEDTLSRQGGDEFTIILENLHAIQNVSSIANKILKNLSQSMNVNNNVLYISSSIGISIYPDDGQDAQSLLKFADSAMYKAKKEGRNNYQYYSSEMTEQAFERVVMETALRAGIKNEEFVVYYQPQVNGETNQLIGMEALVRWKHPAMGIVSPAKFIPLAESTGLIVELDRYVMKTAMNQVSQWYKDGLNPGVLAMNLAVKQLKQNDFIDMFQRLMKETTCKSEWLELEVTEGQIMEHPEEAIEILHRISNLGIELAVDDFGTGYSSLAYLKKLPINKLKIDQTFVRDLPDDEEDVGISRAVIALAKSLHLKVIAEGVETKEQRDFLVENGCENIQGYFYSKPLPANEIEQILKDGKLKN